MNGSRLWKTGLSLLFHMFISTICTMWLCVMFVYVCALKKVCTLEMYAALVELTLLLLTSIIFSVLHSVPNVLHWVSKLLHMYYVINSCFWFYCISYSCFVADHPWGIGIWTTCAQGARAPRPTQNVIQLHISKLSLMHMQLHPSPCTVQQQRVAKQKSFQEVLVNCVLKIPNICIHKYRVQGKWR